MTDPRIKVMYLMDYYYGTTGGTEGQLWELIKSLDRIQFQPCMTVLRPTAYLKHNGFPCPVEIFNIRKLLSLAAIRGLLKISKTIRQSKINIVHILFNDASMIAPLFCKLGGAKVIVSRRDLGLWYTPAKLAALKLSNLFVDRVVANSNAVRENVEKMEGCPSGKVRVIYNGHAYERFHKAPAKAFRESHGIEPNDPIIGIVANLYGMKRHADLIRAFSLVKQKLHNAHLVIAGEGPEEQALRELAKALHLEPQVHFLGSVSDIVPIIKHFMVAVMCSESEGLSNTIIEYVGCGKPVICTSVGGNGELIREGYNGFLIDVGNVEQIADRILRLLRDASLRVQMARNAAASFGGHLSLERMVNAYMALYESLTRGEPHEV